MKKVFLYTGICALFIGIFLIPQISFGKTYGPLDRASSLIGNVPKVDLVNSLTPEQKKIYDNLPPNQQTYYIAAIANGSTPENAVTSAVTADQKANPKKEEINGSSCVGFWGCSVSDIALNIINTILYYVVFKITSLALSVSGFLLNWVVDTTIVHMAEGISQMTGINIAWKVIRDIMNMLFIFMLLYEGITLIIGVGSQKRARDFVVGIVMASLLINFSLFFTKIIIDASNVATIGFYNSIIGQNPPTNSSTNTTDTSATSTLWTTGLSNAFMGSLGLQGFLGPNSIANTGGDPYRALILVVAGSILFLVEAFIFFAISILLIVRYIVLILLLMLSPVGYMGLAGFPGMKSYAKTWWDSLIGQCLFAPVYMIMTWIIITLMTSHGFLTTGNPSDWAGLAGDGPSVSKAIGLILNFVLIIGLMIASLVVAKSTSKQGAKQIGDFAGKATAFAGGALLGGAAAGGRKVFGGLGLGKSSIEELEAREAAGGFQGLRAKARLGLARGSFDVRRSNIGETIAGATGVSLGRGTEGIPFMGNAKAGEGGRGAKVLESKKDSEGNMDKVMKPFVDKRQWPELAAYVKKNKNEKEQRYIYKKLSARDKISFDKALADPALTSKLREKLPIDDQIKLYTDNKDWGPMATWLMTKTPQEQDYIYEKMSARDRVELDGKKGLETIPGGPGITTRMRGALSVEELEKTKESGKKAKRAEENEARFDNIDNIIAGRPTAPVGQTIDTILDKLPSKEARNINLSALNNTSVIEKLSPGHLADIVSNHNEIDDATKKVITDHILLLPAGSYPMQAKQTTYLGSSKAVEASWGI